MAQLNILLIPGYKLFPIDSGGAHYQLSFLARQQHLHNIDLLVTPQNVAAEHLGDLKKKFPPVNVIPVGYGKRSILSKWLAFLIKQYGKFRKTQFPYTVKKVKHLHNLRPRDIELIKAINQLTRFKNYDVIQAEHTINLGLVEIFPGKPIKVFVHHEIGHTRIHSDLLATGHSQEEAGRVSSIARKMEISWLNKYDGIITLCQEDKALLVKNRVTVPIKVSQPFAYFEDDLDKTYDANLEPHLLFMGGELHFPNKEGLIWFLQDVYPLVRQKVNDIKLLVTGNWTEDFKNRYSADPGIHFTGFLKDLKPVFKKGILIIPVRIGSGIRVKAIMAFAHALPVVSTPFAVSGIPGLEHNKNILLADDAGQFAKCIIDLVQNTGVRKKISDQIFELALSEYEKSSLAGERDIFYQELINDKKSP